MRVGSGALSVLSDLHTMGSKLAPMPLRHNAQLMIATPAQSPFWTSASFQIPT